MNDKESLTDWLGSLLWYWQGDTGISPDALAEKIMDVLDEHQKHALRLLGRPLPDPQGLLQEMETPLGRTENL